MRVLVCGDRNWPTWRTPYYEAIHQRIRALPPGVTIVVGDCRGVDTLARIIGERLGLTVEVHRADWLNLGRAAGPIRNRGMLDSGIDVVLAFHEDLSRSRGTADTVRQARQRGVPVEVIGPLAACLPGD